MEKSAIYYNFYGRVIGIFVQGSRNVDTHSLGLFHFVLILYWNHLYNSTSRSLSGKYWLCFKMSAANNIKFEIEWQLQYDAQTLARG